MSSRSKDKRGNRANRVEYPGLWGEWMWHEQYQRYYRARLKGPDEYEYEYGQPPTSDTPRTAESSDLGPATDSYSQSQNYTTSSSSGTSRPAGTSRTSKSAGKTSASGPADVDSITDSFGKTSISPTGGTYATPATYGTPVPYTANTGSFQAPASSGYPNVVSTPYAAASSHGGQAYVSPSMGWQNHIKTRDPYTDREDFDPHYKVHQAWNFKWGRIFKVLWAEPKGAEGGGSSGQSGTGSVTVRKVAGGKEAYAKVRRFVIIKPMEGHCICLPILTYSGQGLNKRGVHADHHAIIYSGKKPVAFRGEKERGLQMRSIKVTPDSPRHKLDDASRLNYAKTYTVEYNVKVWFIGKVSSDSEWQIRTDYNRVHPPLDLRGLQPPPDGQDELFDYAGGGAAGTEYATSYAGYTTPYASPYTSNTAYPAASGNVPYTASYATAQPSSGHDTYGSPHEGGYATSTSTTHNPYFPASSTYQAPGESHGSSSQTYERRELGDVDEKEEEEQAQQRREGDRGNDNDDLYD
ncbi:hypothetical protein L207DRAFT_347188 [Hyaloscypha variabilis F]|uniref:DUF6590 domain-containing protein n=1 Tax=Hyaloscypha variabilis (strain UAMH 11265 / GT02V1 / F) TaxID=1149755 RepID=A0A2J6RQY6_HYAVF|nr:hypothetical protein L207DRAFT_347188 [Hyaloscypha variabilis F]